ncbi:heavy-metal-associated domain-containing protein [Brevundimonas bullata]|jgi:copper chaperone|uniref:heavy-metal-associated domain-containing protein n=1 Tax=Brevundimonas bullata TaxID=13160 RepID=UPI000E0B6D6D|nr:heavy-metal-associated domain-containing protein [Brevundimonas bullata]WQE37965.1 heavy-metal-associated domain-containing protein [Brevundimonas bullata]
MTIIKLNVERMTCGGCAATVKAAVLEVAPTARVEIEIATGTLRVEGADEAEVRAAIERAGYGVA